MPPPVGIPARILNELCEHAREAEPEECCGLVLSEGEPAVRTGGALPQRDDAAPPGGSRRISARQPRRLLHEHARRARGLARGGAQRRARDGGLPLARRRRRILVEGRSLYARHALFPFPHADQIVLSVLERSVREIKIFVRSEGRIQRAPRARGGVVSSRASARAAALLAAGCASWGGVPDAELPAQPIAIYYRTPAEARLRADALQRAARGRPRCRRRGRRSSGSKAYLRADADAFGRLLESAFGTDRGAPEAHLGRLALLDPRSRRGRAGRGRAARRGAAGVVARSRRAAVRAADRAREPRRADLRVERGRAHGAARHGRAAGSQPGLLWGRRADRRDRRRDLGRPRDVADPDQRARRPRAVRGLSEGPADHSPTCAPDGSAVVFARARTPLRSEIWLAAAPFGARAARARARARAALRRHRPVDRLQRAERPRRSGCSGSARTARAARRSAAAGAARAGRPRRRTENWSPTSRAWDRAGACSCAASTAAEIGSCSRAATASIRSGSRTANNPPIPRRSS